LAWKGSKIFFDPHLDDPNHVERIWEILLTNASEIRQFGPHEVLFARPNRVRTDAQPAKPDNRYFRDYSVTGHAADVSNRRERPILEVGPSAAVAQYALMRGAELRRMGGPMYMFIRKYTKVRSVADAARRAKSGVGQILRESHGFRSYYVLDGGDGVGVGVMIFEDRESANAANAKVREFVQASLLDLNLGDPEIIAGEVLVNIESGA